MSSVTVIEGRTLIGRRPTGDEPPVLTVELTHKWYNLWLMHSNGCLYPVTYSEIEEHATDADYGLAYRDHVPNPYYVEQLASTKRWTLNPLALEMIIGRWMSEAMNNTYESYVVDYDIGGEDHDWR